MTWEVQHYTLCGGWTNMWSVNDELEVFATKGAAQAELDAFLADIAGEIARGERAPEDGYSRAEFRIVRSGRRVA